MKDYYGLPIMTRADYRCEDSKRGLWRRTTFEASPDLWKKVQRDARIVGCSSSELIRAILEAWFDGRVTLT